MGAVGAGKTTLLTVMESVLSQTTSSSMTKRVCSGHAHCTLNITTYSYGHISQKLKEFYITDTVGFESSPASD